MVIINFLKSIYLNILGLFEDPLGYLVKNLFYIHKGVPASKLEAMLSLAFASSPVFWLYEKLTHWTMSNNDYIGFVLGAIIIDHILGSIVHGFIKRDFTFKKNVVGLVTKIGLALAMGFLFEGINYIVKADTLIKEYLLIVLRLTVFFYPAGSAVWNCAIITKGKFPPIGFINKMKGFNKDLDLSHFRDKKVDKINNDNTELP